MTTHKRTTIGLVLAAVMLLGGAIRAVSAAESGGSEDTEAEAKNIPAEVRAILRDVSDYYSGLDSMKMEASLELSITASGVDRTMEQDMTLSARKPNRLLLDIERGNLGGTAIIDGEFLYAFFPDEAAYLTREAPEDFSGLAEIPALVLLYSRSGAPPILLNLLHPDPYAALTNGVTEGSYRGAETVRGQSCHHLQLNHEQFDWDLWIRKGDTPVVEKVKTNMTRAVRQVSQKKAPANLDARSTVKLSSWAADPDLADETFQFSAPEGATEYGSLIALLRSTMEGRERESMRLRGEEAPDFTAPVLDGDEVTLSDHEGSDVVVLDFWATWCPPCVQAMPKLNALAEKYSDKDVAVYAVNVGEPAGRVRQFMSRHELSLTVVLDSKGQVSRSYNARSLPQTVVIGKDGTVQAAHLGFMPNMESTLSDQIDKLLAGESLVESGGD
ncbi:MAG: redoxin domain-containing protein [Planctomycetota bacterium]